MKTRESSNSITHLVKIVAQEVIKEELGKVYEALHESASEHTIATNKRLAVIEQELCLTDIPEIENTPTSWNAENAGQKWDRDEEYELANDWSIALAWLARRRKRSVGSIDARLRHLIRSHLI